MTDGEYYTRVDFHTITADTTKGTFEWILETSQETRGAPPGFPLRDQAAVSLASRSEHHDNPRRGLGIYVPGELCEEGALVRDHEVEIIRLCCTRYQRKLRERDRRNDVREALRDSRLWPAIYINFS